MHKFKLLLSLILCILMQANFTNCKAVKCREYFTEYNNFFYCTKFSVGKNQALQSNFTAKFSRNQNAQFSKYAQPKFQNRTAAKLTLALYDHKGWKKVDNNPEFSCQKKLSHATWTDEIRLNIDSTPTTKTFVKAMTRKHVSTLYYVAMMDCDNEVESMVGDKYLGKVQL